MQPENREHIKCRSSSISPSMDLKHIEKCIYFLPTIITNDNNKYIEKLQNKFLKAINADLISE